MKALSRIKLKERKNKREVIVPIENTHKYAKLIQTDAPKVDRPESLLDNPFQFSLAIMRTNMHTFPQFLPPIIAHQIQSAVEPTPRVPAKS